jgi:thiamine-phosphate pyrophosphorylase
LVQLRDKHAADGDFVSLGRKLVEVLKPLGVPFIINDRVHLFAAIGADGMHVGQSDLDARAARQAIGPDAILGLSIENIGQLAAVDTTAVDYLGVGPLRATPVKPDHAEPIGHHGFAAICAASTLPCVAIGAITADDAAPVKAAGGAGLAIVSAICAADDPETATRRIVNAWRKA